MPSASPSARTDCPSTASRRDGQQTRHESGTPCPMPQERTTRPAPRPDGHAAARRPYAASLPAQIEQTEPAGEPRASREERGREPRETGRKCEDLRPLACRIAAQVIKASNPARSQPDRSQRRRPAGTPPATVPSSSPSPCLPAVNSAFGEFAEPRPVFARQQTNNGTPPACQDATGTGGAFTFSRPLRFSRNGSVPPLYHVRPISPFFTREQSRRFPNNK